SVEDLWAFNDENLVRAVAASRTPVISAVGHETDFTLCDFAADLRAPTPSAACELAIPERAALAEQVGSLKRRLAQALQRIGMKKRMYLDQILSRKPLRFPMDRIAVLRQELDERVRQGSNAMECLVRRNRERLFSLRSKLDALNPLSVLKRGYTLTYILPQRTPAGSAGRLKPGADIEVVFHDGSVLAEVTDRKGKR
ncbi:MAG: exodeoxyribonuclease VII large subunit, partial [Armatimonadetes bacterium]|nr:exodeoxyribonuclease VII large subunit [Armatimonadota bacterium]